jgi:hypothetical protein
MTAIPSNVISPKLQITATNAKPSRLAPARPNDRPGNPPRAVMEDLLDSQFDPLVTLEGLVMTGMMVCVPSFANI